MRKKVLYKPKQDAYNAHQFRRGTEQRPQVLPFRGTRVSGVFLFSIFMDTKLRLNSRNFPIIISLVGAILWFSGPIASQFSLYEHDLSTQNLTPKGIVLVEYVKPKVFLVGETRIIEDGLKDYLAHVGVPDWTSDAPSDAERLSEVMGRLCYRSFEPGLNPNVTRVREGNEPYLRNILNVGHGSVIEHPVLNFIFSDVSRVFTHELVRHRAGSAMSQESLRFVRLDKLSAYAPTHITENEEGMKVYAEAMEKMEEVQIKLAEVYDIDNQKNFGIKKKLTSAFRRVAPIGVATTIGWSCNFRTLRHVIEMRTEPSAEEEIRLVFSQVYYMLKERYPNLLGDYEVEMVDGLPWVKTPHRKV